MGRLNWDLRHCAVAGNSAMSKVLNLSFAKIPDFYLPPKSKYHASEYPPPAIIHILFSGIIIPWIFLKIDILEYDGQVWFHTDNNTQSYVK
jgi:hypothetical protein